MKVLKYGVVCPDEKPAQKSEPVVGSASDVIVNPEKAAVSKKEVPLKKGRALDRAQAVERMYERFGPAFEELAK